MKVIVAENFSIYSYLQQVWRYRSLIKLVAIRDLKIQYSQTLLGLTWVIVQPLVAILIYSIFFYKILGIKTGGTPYPLFAFSGIMGWFTFTYIINSAGSSLVDNRDLIKRVEFPKLILPLAKCLGSMINFGVSLGLLFLFMIFYGQVFTIKILLLPLFIFINVFLGLTIGIWLASLTIRFRDFFHIIPYLISFGIWVTPVFYPTTILPLKYTYILYFNPLAGVIAGYRWTLLDMPAPSPYYLLSMLPVLLLFGAGVRFFIHTEQIIVDYL